MRVLLVEDDASLAEATARGLRLDSMAVDTAATGGRARDLLGIYAYDVMLLDRDLPDMSGDEVCRYALSLPDGPRVLMLTAAATVRERVAGLRLGADDYLIKPFDFDELLARIHSLHRRNANAAPPQLESRSVRLDPFRRTVLLDGEPVMLTRKEFAVLEILMRADGAPVHAEDLLDQAWPAGARADSSVVRMTVSNLRRRLGRGSLVRTVVGVGYRFDD